MNQVAATKIEPVRTSQTAPAQADGMISMLERVLMDPSIPIERLERLVELQDKTIARQAKTAFMAAMAEMQMHLPVIAEKGEIKTGGAHARPQSTYALWADVNEAIVPVLQKYGFSLTFKIATPDKITVTGILSHREGHSEETSITLPIDSSGSKNAVQAVASSVSYGKRYTAGALLNLTSRARIDADDDGRAAGGKPTISDDQVTEIRELLFETGANLELFLKAAKVESLQDILAANFPALCDRVRQRASKRVSA